MMSDPQEMQEAAGANKTAKHGNYPHQKLFCKHTVPPSTILASIVRLKAEHAEYRK
jgi:hypothetical protein